MSPWPAGIPDYWAGNLFLQAILGSGETCALDTVLSYLVDDPCPWPNCSFVLCVVIWPVLVRSSQLTINVSSVASVQRRQGLTYSTDTGIADIRCLITRLPIAWKQEDLRNEILRNLFARIAP